ncbi:MAG: hypothetical protein H6767_02225 [Candidatus Peribacteria bacterium]|nr:MAG: hypothetical protein H6767_02225 [Candidatus Peribacteria bacterium]
MGTIISYKMLTADVLELGVELDTPVDVLPGQYAVMILQDFDGEFSRSYSLVYAKGKKLTFGIKLQDTGR